MSNAPGERDAENGFTVRARAIVRDRLLGSLPGDVRSLQAAQRLQAETQAAQAEALAALRTELTTRIEVELAEARGERDALTRAVRQLLAARGRPPHPPGGSAAPNLAPRSEPTYAQALAALGERAPGAFPAWERLLQVNADVYAGFPIHSCSVEGHPMSQVFAGFVRPYLQGAVLDLGCGPQPVPLYLEGYPSEWVAGVDPLEPPAPHPFAFARGFAEHLPWGDGRFDVVVCATSLDHVLLVDRALAEVARVLTPGGRFLVWQSFVEDAPPYDPYGEPVEPIDAYHLFHFSREAFSAALADRFEETERYDFPGGEAFCAFQLRG